MSTATTHAQNGNLKLILNLTGTSSNTLQNEKQEIPFQAIKLSHKLHGHSLFLKNELINK